MSLQTIDILVDYCSKYSQVWQILVNMELESLLKQKFFNNNNKNFEIALYLLKYVSKYCQSMILLDSDNSQMEEFFSEFKLESLNFSVINTVCKF